MCAIFGSTGDIEGCVADVSILESALSEAALESPQIQGLLKSGAGTTVILDANLGPGPLVRGRGCCYGDGDARVWGCQPRGRTYIHNDEGSGLASH